MELYRPWPQCVFACEIVCLFLCFCEMIVNFGPLHCHLLVYDSLKMSLFNGSLCVNNAELPALAAKFGSASRHSLARLTHAHTHTLVIISVTGLRSLTSSLSTSFTSRCDTLPTSCREVTTKSASMEKSRVGCLAVCLSVLLFLFFLFFRKVQIGSPGPSLSLLFVFFSSITLICLCEKKRMYMYHKDKTNIFSLIPYSSVTWPWSQFIDAVC